MALGKNKTLEEDVEYIIKQLFKIQSGPPSEIILCGTYDIEKRWFRVDFLETLNRKLNENGLGIPVRYGESYEGYSIDLDYYYEKNNGYSKNAK